MTWMAGQVQCSTGLKAVSQDKVYSLYVVAASDYPSLALFSPPNYHSPSAPLNQAETNEYTFIYSSTVLAFLKEVQVFQQDKGSPDCKRRETVWLKDLCAARGHDD